MQPSQCPACGSIETVDSGCRWCHTEINESGLKKTGRVFSLDKYRQWVKETFHENTVPDWVRACNGVPVYIENDVAIVIGIDGVCRVSSPEWEEIAQ